MKAPQKVRDLKCLSLNFSSFDRVLMLVVPFANKGRREVAAAAFAHRRSRALQSKQLIQIVQ